MPMEELDVLKKNWQKAEQTFSAFSQDDIYNMLRKKSSSIVKWIFYISIIELAIGIIVTIVNPKIKDSMLELPKWLESISYISIPVIIYFTYRFYQSYQKISSTDNVKSLLDNIINTRRTVKLYVIINLILVGVFTVFAVFFAYTQTHETIESFKDYAIFGIVIVSATALLLGAAFAVYYLLYGILLGRLNRNYNELKKLE